MGDLMAKRSEHPMQPVILDKNKVARFKENTVVRKFLDEASAGRKFDLNDLVIAQMPIEDLLQFYQLIGYSVSGYGDIFYHKVGKARKSVQIADEAVEALLKGKKRG